MPTKTTIKPTTRKPSICHPTSHPTLSGSSPQLSTMPGPTKRFASVEQQEQFLRHALLTGKDLTNNHPEEQMSAHIKEVDKDLNPLDNSGPDKPPQDKGKGCAEGEHPNNSPPDDRNGPGSSDDSNNDSDGSEVLK